MDAESSGEKISISRRSTRNPSPFCRRARSKKHLAGQSDIRAAVLYRTNSQSRVFEEAMRVPPLSLQHRRRLFVFRT